MTSLQTTVPKGQLTPTDPWEEAFLRVEAYLQAMQVKPHSLVAEIAASTCKAARDVESKNNELHPVKLSMQVLQASLSACFGGAFPNDPPTHLQRARGRLAVLISDAAPAVGMQLPQAESCPPELCVTLRESFLQSGPELRLSKMPPASIEFGFGDSDEVVPSMRQWLPNPALIVALLVMSAIGGVLAAAR